MSDIHVTYDGDTYWLQCFSDDPSAEMGVIVDPIDIGDSWITLAEKVAEHQAQHGCAPEPEPTPAKVIVVTDDNGRDRRYTAPNFGMLHDGTLLIGDKTEGDDLVVDAALAPGRWSRVHKDGTLADGPEPFFIQGRKLAIALDALKAIEDEPHPGYGPERAAKAFDDIADVDL